MLTSSKRKDNKRLLCCYCNYFARKLITQKSLFVDMLRNSTYQIKSFFNEIITADKYTTVSIPLTCQLKQQQKSTLEELKLNIHLYFPPTWVRITNTLSAPSPCTDTYDFS